MCFHCSNVDSDPINRMTWWIYPVSCPCGQARTALHLAFFYSQGDQRRMMKLSLDANCWCKNISVKPCKPSELVWTEWVHHSRQWQKTVISCSFHDWEGTRGKAKVKLEDLKEIWSEDARDMRLSEKTAFFRENNAVNSHLLNPWLH